jgi:hypothetical protein
MVFIETPVFTKQVVDLLTDEEYGAFQQYLIANPEAGDVVQDTGGLRKIRWKTASSGKSGGVRVIYFHVLALSQARLLLIYKKGRKDDLTADEKKTLKKLNSNW